MEHDERTLVAATCARRAALELYGAASFTTITQDLIDLEADVRIVELSAQALRDELRHAEIYRELARGFGATIGEQRAHPIERPRYGNVTENEARMLRVVSMCSINETMACSFLELCLRGATVPEVRNAVHEVLEDEIKHARIGWAYLGSRDASDRERAIVSRILASVMALQWKGWREQIDSLPDFECPAYGCPSPAAIERASLASMRELVLPGFERAGVDVREALRWLETEEA